MDIVVEAQSWSVKAHAGWSEKKFIGTYMSGAYGHIYADKPAEDKKATLHLAYDLIAAANSK